MPSTKLCFFQGLVQLTVPPPGWSGTRLWYSRESKISTPGDPGPPRNLCGEKYTASSFSSGSAGCMSMST